VSVFLALLGLAMMVGGLAAIYSGSLFVGIERGWTMVVSGTVAFSAGAILLGLAAALRRLKRIERATKRLAGAFAPPADPAPPGPIPSKLGSVAASAPAAAPSPPEVTTAASLPGQQGPENEPSPEHREPPPAPDKVVGTYQAGGNSYVMYADGSIRADTPSGEHRFATMDEFKAFMLTGTPRAPAKPEAQTVTPPSDPAPAPDNPTAFSAKA
jgi:hypothetical protein